MVWQRLKMIVFNLNELNRNHKIEVSIRFGHLGRADTIFNTSFLLLLHPISFLSNRYT